MNLTYFTSGRRERVFDAILKAGHSIEELIVTDPRRWPNVIPTMKLAELAGIKIRVVSKSDVGGLANHLTGRICLSVGFAYIFPGNVITSAKLMLNVHGTLLPKYAGARTGNWVIAEGEKESGVTVHAIDAGVDTGAILLQKKFPLDVFENAVSLGAKLADFEPGVVVEAIRLLESGTASFVEQSASLETKWPNRNPGHSELDPNRPLKELVQEILACDPQNYPAFFYHKNHKVYLRIWTGDAERAASNVKNCLPDSA